MSTTTKMTEQEYRNIVSKLPMVGSGKVYTEAVAKYLCDVLMASECDNWTYKAELQNVNVIGVYNVVAYDDQGLFAGYF